MSYGILCHYGNFLDDTFLSINDQRLSCVMDEFIHWPKPYLHLSWFHLHPKDWPCMLESLLHAWFYCCLFCVYVECNASGTTFCLSSRVGYGFFTPSQVAICDSIFDKLGFWFGLVWFYLIWLCFSCGFCKVYLTRIFKHIWIYA